MATDTYTAPSIMGTASRPKIYKNFIDGEWVESASGDTFENLNPADTRDVAGIFQRSGRRMWTMRWKPLSGPSSLAAGSGASAGRDPLSRREILAERKEEYCPRHDPRDGKDSERDARRRAGSHRYRVLHGRRRPADVRADHAFRTAQQVRHGGAPAGGRLRHDCAVEFPHGDSILEAVPGPGVLAIRA